MKILGRHILAEFVDCNKAALDDIEALEKYLTNAVRRSGATIVKSVFHRYNPQGLSGVVVIAESHISIHTWPEYGYAAVDFFTCGERVNPWKACESLKVALGARDVQAHEVARGIPSEKDEIIPHKPTLAQMAQVIADEHGAAVTPITRIRGGSVRTRIAAAGRK